MKVVNICTDDYANYGYNNAAALRAVGVDAHSYCLNPHPFNYENASTVIKRSEVRKVLRGATVQVMHSDVNFCIYAHVVYHTGTMYRQSPRRIEKKFRRKKAVYNMAEFSETCKGTYLVNVAPTHLEPSYTPTGKIRHHPSVSSVKGTDKLAYLVPQASSKEFIYTTAPMPHKEVIEAVRDCDIYAEMFAPTQNGKRYGSFGVSAMEAAALGKVVVTNFFYKDLYEREYGELGLRIANTEQDFINQISWLSNRYPEELVDLQKASRKWAEKHSLEATGARILNNIL